MSQLKEKRAASGKRRPYVAPSAQIGVARILVSEAVACKNGNKDGKMVPIEAQDMATKEMFVSKGVTGAGHFVYNDILNVAAGKEYPIYKKADGTVVVNLHENGKDLIRAL